MPISLPPCLVPVGSHCIDRIRRIKSESSFDQRLLDAFQRSRYRAGQQQQRRPRSRDAFRSRLVCFLPDLGSRRHLPIQPRKLDSHIRLLLARFWVHPGRVDRAPWNAFARSRVAAKQRLQFWAVGPWTGSNSDEAQQWVLPKHGAALDADGCFAAWGRASFSVDSAWIQLGFLEPRRCAAEGLQDRCGLSIALNYVSLA
jgi:hypothetical protein